jgi:hypothetical protein
MLLGDDPIQDLDRVIRMASNGIERAQLELLPFVAGNYDQLRHISRESVPTKWYVGVVIK